MTWDDESIKQLKKLWEKGLSTTEIAKKMNVSKNSVVGKVHRLCLKARPSPIKKKEGEQVSETEQKDLFIAQQEIEQLSSTDTSNEKVVSDGEEQAVKNKIETLPASKSETQPKSKAEKKNRTHIKLVELDSHTCRWPIGDPREEDFCFCGKKVHAGQTYCDEHSQVAYVKANVRK